MHNFTLFRNHITTSEPISTGNTRHFRKSIVNDGSDEHLKRHKNVLTEKEHKQTTYTAYSEIGLDLLNIPFSGYTFI
jgi:hypothetical protein